MGPAVAAGVGTDDVGTDGIGTEGLAIGRVPVAAGGRAVATTTTAVTRANRAARAGPGVLIEVLSW
ncbi:MAG: hypothetical protein ACRCXL_13785 [Dermatophilaceae bacterium]